MSLRLGGHVLQVEPETEANMRLRQNEPHLQPLRDSDKRNTPARTPNDSKSYQLFRQISDILRSPLNKNIEVPLTSALRVTPCTWREQYRTAAATWPNPPPL